MSETKEDMGIERAKKDSRTGLENLGNLMRTVIARATVYFAIVSSLGILVMILMGTIDAIGTKLFDSPLPCTVEATETLMVVLLFGGLSYAQLQRRHIKVELLVDRLSGKIRSMSVLLGYLVGFVFFALLTYECVFHFWFSWMINESSPSLIRFPIYPAKFFMIVGGTLMTLQLAVDIVVEASTLFSRTQQ